MPDTCWIPDQPYREKMPFLTRANAGEVIPEPPSPAGWDLLWGPGVIVDVGAALRHAIIVSRGLVIPCVVSVTAASRNIPDGALVEVNGDAGTVTILGMP